MPALRYKYRGYSSDEPRKDLSARIPQSMKVEWMNFFKEQKITQTDAILEALELWKSYKTGKIDVIEKPIT